MSVLKFCRLRDGVFQYERRVPARIQRDRHRFARLFNSNALFRRSLGSKDEGEAMAVYANVHAEFERRIGNRPDNLTLVPAAATRTLTEADLEDIAKRYFELEVAPFEKLHRLAEVDGSAADELARLQYDRELDAPEFLATLKTPGDAPDGPCLRPIDEARHVIADNGFIAPEGSETFAMIVKAVRLGMMKGVKHIDALATGEIAPRLPTKQQKSAKAVVMTVREAAERYLKDRKPLPKATSETLLSLRQFEAVVGNKRLDQVSRADMIRFVEHLASHKVGGKTEGSVVRHVSKHTIGKRLRMLGAAFRHAKDRGLYDGDNPTRDINIGSFAAATSKAVMPNKRRLKVEELNLIFAHPWFAGCESPKAPYTPGNHRLDDSRYWAPVVAAFTGCRAAELGGMKLADVRLDDRYPHLIVRDNEYRPTKSKRTRCVPLLDALRELGFDDYVRRIAASGADRLFPDWTAYAAKAKQGDRATFPAWSNAAVIRAFNRTVLPDALSEQLVSGVRQEVTFHSLRGAFKAMLATQAKALPTAIINEVIGHAQSEIDERYIAEITIEETYPQVHGCRYEGLIVPSRLSAAL